MLEGTAKRVLGERIATGGGNTNVVDANANYPVDYLVGLPLRLRIGSKEYVREIISNTATQINFAALPVGVSVSAGDVFFFPFELLAALALIMSNTGLCYKGTVTAAVPGASFTIDSLKGLGANIFADATAPYRAFVLRDSVGGIPPQGEMAVITAYTTATGLFTPNGPPAFTVNIAVDDEVIILHPRLAEIFDILTRFNAAGAAMSVVSQPGVTARTNLNAILTDLADILAGAGITNFPDPAAPANGVSVAEVLHQIYDDLAAVEVKLDAGGLGAGQVTKALTFANQVGQVNLFTVTGDVIVRIVAVVKTNCGSAGGCNISVGIAATVDAIIPVTDITLLAAQEIWFDATPDSEIEALGTMREHIISDGNDITLNSSAADNSGAITFYCFWTALSAGATVVAA